MVCLFLFILALGRPALLIESAMPAACWSGRRMCVRSLYSQKDFVMSKLGFELRFSWLQTQHSTNESPSTLPMSHPALYQWVTQHSTNESPSLLLQMKQSEFFNVEKLHLCKGLQQLTCWIRHLDFVCSLYSIPKPWSCKKTFSFVLKVIFVCPWLDFYLPTQCTQVVWCH